MRYSQYLVVSCGASHLTAAHLKMNASGRCELSDYLVSDIGFTTTEPLLWLKAASQQFSSIRRRFKGEIPTGFVLPGNVILTKYLKIPQASPKRRAKVVAFEARQNIPYSIGEVTWDDHLIDENDLEFETVIAAVKTELVEALAAYAKESRMDPDLIEPAYSSLLNGFRFNYSDREECALLVSVGTKSSDIVIADGSSVYSRNIAFGGDTVTAELSEALGLPFPEAEAIKIAASRGDPIPAGEKTAVDRACLSFHKRFTIEVTRTLTLVNRQEYGFEPRRCYLSGGGSLVSGLEEQLGLSLEIPIERYDPVRKVSLARTIGSDDLEQDKPFIGEAIGMAIGRFLPDSLELDLLPRSIVWQRKFRRQQPFYLVAGLVACAAVALPLINAIVSKTAYEEEIQNLDTQINPIRAVNKRVGDKLDSIRKLKSIIEQTSQIAAGRSHWVAFLEDLQQRLASVEDVWLDSIRIVRSDSLRSASKNGLVSRRQGKATAGSDELKLLLQGRLLDVQNPLSMVSQESNQRVTALLRSFSESDFIARLEDERFDNNTPGILRFNFTVVLDPSRPL